MMWCDLVNELDSSNHRQRLSLMARMMIEVANHGCEATASNLTVNVLDIHFVARTMDGAGIPVSNQLIDLVSRMVKHPGLI